VSDHPRQGGRNANAAAADRPWLTSLIAIAVGGVLLVAALEKLLDLDHWRGALARYPFPLLRNPAIGYGVPALEVCLAAALVFQWQPWAGLSAALLFVAFALVLYAAYRKGARHECGCWGRRVSSRVGPAAIARALVLAVASLATLRIDEGLAWYASVTATVVIALGWLIAQELIRVPWGVEGSPR
jgi:hypothetical protein